MRLRQQRGSDGEEIAARFLQSRGFGLVARNWRPGRSLRGEIDIIALKNGLLCFVEVKTRSSNLFGSPQEAVTPAKQRQISRLANAYLGFHQLHDTQVRFDIVEVWLPSGGEKLPRVALHENAFDYQP